MEQQQQAESTPPTGVPLVPPSTLNIVIPSPIANTAPSTLSSNTPQATSPINTYPLQTTTPTSTPTSMTSPPPPPPPVFNPVNTVTATSPTANVPSTIASNVPAPSVAQMPPLGPAPAQLPPLAHPPPPPPSSSNIPLQVIPNPNLDSTIPVQSQFEALNLNSPSEPTANDFGQPSVASLSSDLAPSQDLINGQLAVSPPADENGEASAIPDDAKPGEYFTIIHFIKRKPFLYLGSPNIIPANMWTRKDIKEFKEQIRKEKEAVIKISSGETVTVGEFIR